jgi:hypothetical protein
MSISHRALLSHFAAILVVGTALYQFIVPAAAQTAPEGFINKGLVGARNAQSLYRKIELLDVTGATNLAGTPYDGVTPVAPKGQLVADVVPAKLTPFIDINDSAQLAKFGLHNGAPNDRTNLSEKWEGMGLVPALDPANPNDYFLMVVNTTTS